MHRVDQSLVVLPDRLLEQRPAPLQRSPQLVAVEHRQVHCRAHADDGAGALQQIRKADGLQPGIRHDVDVRVEVRLGGSHASRGRLDPPALRRHIGPARQQVHGQPGGQRQFSGRGKLRARQIQAAVGAGTNESCQLGACKIDAGLGECHACACQSRDGFRLAHARSRLQSRFGALARQVKKRGLLLQVRFRHIVQRVLQIELDVRARDGNGQSKPGGHTIRRRSLNAGLGRLERLAVAAPEVEVVAEVQRETAVGHKAATIRGWNEIVGGVALTGRLPVDYRARSADAARLQHGGLRGMQPRLGNSQSRCAGQGLIDEAVELGIAKPFPPGVGRPCRFIYAHRGERILRCQRFGRNDGRRPPVAVRRAACKGYAACKGDAQRRA